VLWKEVSEHNAATPIAVDDKVKVYFYFGQYVEGEESTKAGGLQCRRPSVAWVWAMP